MSRLAKKPIIVPNGVNVTAEEQMLRVKGPKGELVVAKLPFVRVLLEEGNIRIVREGEDGGNQGAANVGTMWSLVQNAVEGVTNGFTKILEIEGVGYRIGIEGKTVVLNIGFSHPVRISIPNGIETSVEKNSITVFGIDKALVGKIAAEIRATKKPEPYLGKGIHYRGEIIRRKAGKKAATTSA